jgi:hypothetical protein
VATDGFKKIVSAVPRRLCADFCNKIGTSRTWRDVRVESLMRSKADTDGIVGQALLGASLQAVSGRMYLGRGLRC